MASDRHTDVEDDFIKDLLEGNAEIDGFPRFDLDYGILLTQAPSL
jgi:hypothetical protein